MNGNKETNTNVRNNTKTNIKNIIENNTEKVVPYYYFENKDIVVFKYSNTTYQEFAKLISFKNDDMFAILNIELNYPAGEGYDQDHYRIKFKTDNGSYYFYSIEKL